MATFLHGNEKYLRKLRNISSRLRRVAVRGFVYEVETLHCYIEFAMKIEGTSYIHKN
jgi:hypothetical protein